MIKNTVRKVIEGTPNVLSILAQSVYCILFLGCSMCYLSVYSLTELIMLLIIADCFVSPHYIKTNANQHYMMDWVTLHFIVIICSASLIRQSFAMPPLVLCDLVCIHQLLSLNACCYLASSTIICLYFDFVFVLKKPLELAGPSVGATRAVQRKPLRYS